MSENPVMMLFPINKAKLIKPQYLFVGKGISKIIYSLPYDLKNAGIDIDAERYSLAAIVSASIYFILFLFIGSLFGFVITREFGTGTILISVLISITVFFAMLMFHLIFPRMKSGQIARSVEQDLLFALRTLLIQISSGISLFEAMKLISKSNYGQVSREFENAVKDINSGLSQEAALEKLAFNTKSDIFKKVLWQILTTMKSGGSLVSSLTSSVEELVNLQMQTIKSYSAELNIWTLVYLIVAAAMPSLGVTFMVIASAIGSSGIGPESVILIAVLAISIQIGLIIIIRTRVPKVIK